MEEKERLLKDYSVGVSHPEVSGFEILELLDLRSRIAGLENELSEEQKRRLEEADSLFLKEADVLYENLSQVADLAKMRAQKEVSPSQWWWYLEKLARVEKVSLGGRP